MCINKNKNSLYLTVQLKKKTFEIIKHEMKKKHTEN